MRLVLFFILLMLLAGTVSAATISPGALKTAITTPVTSQIIAGPGTAKIIQPTETTNMMGSLTINSNPAGAEIWINGQKTPYYTPMNSPAYPYGYLVALKYPDYEMYTEQFTLQPGQAYTISATLVPLAGASPQPTNPPADNTPANPQVTDQFLPAPAAATGSQTPQPPVPGAGSQTRQSTISGAGSLSVTTNPAGAKIMVDGIPAGASPATIPGLSAGMHNLTIIMTGYEDLITQVNIVEGQTMEYSTTLVPAAGPSKSKTPGFETAVAGLAVASIVLLKRAA